MFSYRYIYLRYYHSQRTTYSVVRISRESILTRASIITRYIMTHGIIAACTWYRAFIYIIAMHLTVADITGLALAKKIRGKITTFGIFDATPGQRWIVAFVDVCEYNFIGGFYK